MALALGSAEVAALVNAGLVTRQTLLSAAWRLGEMGMLAEEDDLNWMTSGVDAGSSWRLLTATNRGWKKGGVFVKFVKP